MPGAVNLGTGASEPSATRERVPSPKCPFDPHEQSELFTAWQEGLGAGIHFMNDLIASEESPNG